VLPAVFSRRLVHSPVYFCDKDRLASEFMTRQGKILLLGLLIAAVVVAAGVAAILKRKEGTKTVNPVAQEIVRQQQVEPLRFGPMDWIEVREVRLSAYVPLTGTVRAVESASVKAKVAGELKMLGVREGMAVQRGDVIGLIDPTDYELRLREREAQLRQAEAQLLTAQRNADANSQLVARGFISENSSANTLSALDAARAARDAVNFQLEQARKALADTRLIAPIDGVVAERLALPGEKLSPDNRVVHIVNIEQLEVEASVPSQDIGAIRIGQQLELNIEGQSAEVLANVVRINPATSGSSRNVIVYLRLLKPGPNLRVGSFAQGSLPVDVPRDRLAVPFNALREHAGRTSVWQVREGRLASQDVVTGLRDERARAANGAIGMVEIREGLKPGDILIATALSNAVTAQPLREGDPVELQKP